jgi:hypothetical protein
MDHNQIKKVLLEIIAKECPSGTGQSGGILQKIEKILNISHNDEEEQQAVLTVWNDLFRIGLLAWGLDFCNPDPPFFHVTDKGRNALKHISRDPSNPDGYLHYLETKVELSDTTKSYVIEALQTYNSNNYKASAVMIGCASESIIIEMANNVVNKLESLNQSPNKKLSDWKIKTILEGIKSFFDSHKSDMPKEVFELYEANWSSFAHQIRQGRNEAGHPSSIKNILEENVLASLLVFQELAKISQKLNEFIKNLA